MVKKLNFFIILVIVLASGTVYFTLFNSFSILIMLLIGTLSTLLIKKHISKYNFMVFYFISFLILINSIININNDISISSLFSLLIKLFCAMIICSNINKETFKKNYIFIIEVMCIISLVCFSLSFIIPFDRFPLSRYESVSGFSFMFSPYHTWGWESAFNRNAGMFWEPGAFEIYINVALVFLLDLKRMQSKDIYKILLFIITIITTKSTTGYIVLLMIMVYIIVISLKSFRSKRSWKIIFFGYAFIIATCYMVYLNQSVILNKFTDNNISYNIRKTDYKQTMELITSRPLVGFGYISGRYKSELSDYNIYNNSNGLLYFCGMFGVIIMALFFTLMYINFKNLLDKFNPKVFFTIIMIMNLSEYVILMPFFLLFLYKFKECTLKKEVQ